MKILSITAGAAQMYCGSCLRDNALAAELIRRGHDAMLLPVYTPTRTDEVNVSADRVFFGGISVYLEQHVPVFRKSPKLFDRLWDSTAALRFASRRSIAVDPSSLGALTVSMLKGEAGNQHKEVEKLVEWLRHETAPDVTVLPNSLLISLARPVKEATGRPVCVTLQGEDLFIDGLPEADRRQTLELIRANVPHVDAFVAVSDYYAAFMRELLGVPEEKMRVVPLGINLEGFEPRAREANDADDAAGARDHTFTVGFFGRVAPEKGLHVLAEAYKLFRERDGGGAGSSRLEVGGYLAPEHRDYLRGVERRMKEWGLASEFGYRGAPGRDAKIEFLRGLDAFSLPATYDEPKGLSLIEAMACGVPAVVPRRGAFTELIARTGGGLLVEPDDARALADGLDALRRDRALADGLGRAGAAGVRENYSVARMADRALKVYGDVARVAGGAPGRAPHAVVA
ncbi:MAG: glycosyltransferase family 4 protein [Acidobacteria bacterium]|nr:glycosyltransferase family 4 protein [Acidobacteriota bacterium]MCA1642893.1 glycosyltransferase family 4 protein [Acidobacteriota bacterium]